MGLFFHGIKLDMFYNTKTLNIFSDASMIKGTKKLIGCYGSVAVCMDNIIDTFYNIDSFTTTPACELRGIRSSIIHALKYGDQYENINIFSDSQICIYGLRDYIYKWKIHDGNFYTLGGTVAKNGSLYVECNRLLHMGSLRFKEVNLFHQLGHVNINKHKHLVNSASEFAHANSIIGNIDLNFIRYISTYNDLVDKQSRSILRHTDKRNTYEDALEFIVDIDYLK